MSSPVKLTTPYPTMEDAADLYGIPPARLARLKKMVDEVMRRRSRSDTAKLGADKSEKASNSSTVGRMRKNPEHAQSKKRASKTR
jgi:hypothetical protein